MIHKFLASKLRDHSGKKMYIIPRRMAFEFRKESNVNR